MLKTTRRAAAALLALPFLTAAASARAKQQDALVAGFKAAAPAAWQAKLLRQISELDSDAYPQAYRQSLVSG